MGENRRAQQPRQAAGLRFAASFWDAAESEIEALDALEADVRSGAFTASDFALFLAADRLPDQTRPGAMESIGAVLAALCRARFSN